METKKYKNFKDEKDYNRHRYLHNKEKIATQNRNCTLKRLYGITLEEYNTMLEKQDYRCDCCGILASLLKRRMAVDHNHSTGAVRALLCPKCNTVIANADERIDILELCIEYLERHM